MSKKIFRSILLVCSVILFAGVILIMCVLYGYFGDQKKNELQSEMNYIKSGVEFQGITYLDSLTDKTKRITYIKSDGTVLFDNTADISTLKNHLEREEISSAFKSGTGESLRYSDTLLMQTYYYAEKLNNGNVLRISATQDSVLMMVIGMLQPFALIILAMFILSALFASKVSKKIVAPINKLNIENPLNNNIYEELSPLLTKISKQNKTIERQLKNAKRKQEEFEIITENMSEGILVMDKYTNLLSNNKAVLSLLSADFAKSGQSVFEINRSEEFLSVVENSINGKHCEKILKLNDKVLNLIANPVIFDSKIAGAVIVILDITEKAQREKLRQEFTANVSHELKTPLTSISGFAELMKTGTVKKEDVIDFSNSIYNETKRLITLVNDIIKISVLDENTIPFDESPVDISEIVKQTVTRLKPEAEKNSITITAETEKASIKGNSQIINEMIYNLADNAVKYNKAGGKVILKVKNEENSVTVSVTDTGIGISPENHEKIFERFYRVDKSHSKEIGGTGLGLSIVKHGALYHNAIINIESKINKGTTIKLIFNK